MRLIDENSGLVVNLSAGSARALLAQALGQTHDGDRDVYAELGYPDLNAIDFDDYYARYRRQALARRVVRAPVAYTWRRAPVLHDGEVDSTEAPGSSPFIDDYKRLARDKKLLHYCRAVDRLAGIGRYAILVLGLADGKGLETPALAKSLTGPGQLLYLNAYAEGDAEITAWDDDAASERFGQPAMYRIKLADVNNKGSSQADVHWSRVIHVAEDVDSGVAIGTSRMEAVWNDLIDLDKVKGGSSEAAWINANRGLHVDIRDGFDVDPESLEELSDEVDDYIHKQRRVIRTTGANVNTLGSDVVDPTGLVDVIVTMIAAGADIPKRILIGSERGELASSTDQENWEMVIEDRQQNFAEQVILRPLVDRLRWLGVMQDPQAPDFVVVWSPVFVERPKDLADVVEVKARAAKTLTDAGAGILASAMAAGFSEAEAEAMLLNDYEGEVQP